MGYKFVVFAEKRFKQTENILMEINCAPLHVDLLLYSSSINNIVFCKCFWISPFDIGKTFPKFCDNFHLYIQLNWIQRTPEKHLTHIYIYSLKQRELYLDIFMIRERIFYNQWSILDGYILTLLVYWVLCHSLYAI